MPKIISSKISSNVVMNPISVSLSPSKKLPSVHINLITLSVCSTITLIIPISSSNARMKNVENSSSPSSSTMITLIVAKSLSPAIIPLIPKTQCYHNLARYLLLKIMENLMILKLSNLSPFNPVNSFLKKQLANF